MIWFNKEKIEKLEKTERIMIWFNKEKIEKLEKTEKFEDNVNTIMLFEGLITQLMNNYNIEFEHHILKNGEKHIKKCLENNITIFDTENYMIEHEYIADVINLNEKLEINKEILSIKMIINSQPCAISYILDECIKKIILDIENKIGEDLKNVDNIFFLDVVNFDIEITEISYDINFGILKKVIN